MKGYKHKGTALNAAARNGYPDIVRFLLTLDPKPDIESKNEGWGHSPLHQAAFFVQTECARLLLEAGANPFSMIEGQDHKFPSETVGLYSSESKSAESIQELTDLLQVYENNGQFKRPGLGDLKIINAR